MIDYLLSGERTPTIEVADAIGRVFGVSGWQMIHPEFTADLARSGLDALLTNYIAAKEDGRQIIEKIAEREAKHRPNSQ